MLKHGTLGIAILVASANIASATDLLSDKSVANDASWGWSGAYIGLSTGYGWGDSEHVYDRNDGNHDYPISNDPDGYLIGLTLGYNYMLTDKILFGVEADIGYMDVDAEDKRNLWDGHIWKSQFGGAWGTLRARLGYTMGRMLLYGTAGVAFMDTNQIVLGDDGNADQNTYDVTSHTGYVVGAGAEYKLTQRASAKIEYLYMDFGKTDGYTNNDEHYSFDDSLQIVRVGLNYKF